MNKDNIWMFLLSDDLGNITVLYRKGKNSANKKGKISVWQVFLDFSFEAKKMWMAKVILSSSWETVHKRITNRNRKEFCFYLGLTLSVFLLFALWWFKTQATKTFPSVLKTGTREICHMRREYYNHYLTYKTFSSRHSLQIPKQDCSWLFEWIHRISKAV